MVPASLLFRMFSLPISQAEPEMIEPTTNAQMTSAIPGREIYECSTAASANEALELLAVETFALVITDMMMPGRNGIELLRETKARYPDTAVIMVSGIDRPQRLRDA